mmetsp:Transcript_19100/g.51350  ORF Transcript_19100/g.51350 Transcript_19100/m.51350 type:complete len:346 (-) Transcript_19100:94-1131(-)
MSWVFCFICAVASPCPPMPETLVLITAHVCGERNARLFEDAVRSVEMYAPGARILVVDNGSGNGYNVSAMAPRARVVRPPPAERFGQLGALRVVDQLGLRFSRLVVLQHSTVLDACPPPLAPGCPARSIGGRNLRNAYRSHFWMKHEVGHLLYEALGVDLHASNFTRLYVSAHALVEISYPLFRHIAEKRLWPSEVRGPVANSRLRTLLQRAVRREHSELLLRLNQGIEAMAGALVFLDVLENVNGTQQFRLPTATGGDPGQPPRTWSPSKSGCRPTIRDRTVTYARKAQHGNSFNHGPKRSRMSATTAGHFDLGVDVGELDEVDSSSSSACPRARGAIVHATRR